MRQNPRPTNQRRVVPHMLVVPTSQLGDPMVFFVLEVAGYGLLHGFLMRSNKGETALIRMMAVVIDLIS